MQKVILPLSILLILCISILFVRPGTTPPPRNADFIIHADAIQAHQHIAHDTRSYFATSSATRTPVRDTYAAHPAASIGNQPARQSDDQQHAAATDTDATEAPTPPVASAPTSEPTSPVSHTLAATDAVMSAKSIQVSAVDHFELPSRYFPQTGHNVWGRFLIFYNTHGGVSIFGFPLTEAFREDGTIVQYFERARFELDPSDPQQVHATPLGVILAEQHYSKAAFQRHEPNHFATSVYIQSTGHNIGHWFYDFWQQHGGVAVFGNPISEAFIEMRLPEGQPYRIQYFERARFEAPLDHRGYAQSIHLGLIGHEYLQTVQLPPALLEPTFAIEMLGSATVFVGSSATGSVQNVHLATHKLNGLSVPAGEVGSFLNGIGEVTVQAGYTGGAAIVGGEVVNELGGGICYVSTLLYRAALDAGLEIIERYPHTLALREFSDAPGLDAAVFTPDMDLRLRNDTPGPLLVASDVTPAGEVTIRIWGYDDGRTTTLSNPAIAYYENGSGPIWRYDETMPENTVERIGYRAPGMHVTVERVVSSASSEVLHYDQITSSYAPWQDVFLYGPGIDPVCEQDGAQVRQECQEYHKEKQCNEDKEACAEQDDTDNGGEDGEQIEGDNTEDTATPTPTAPPAPTPPAPPAVLSPTPLAPTPAPAPTEESPVIQNEGAPPPPPEGAPPAEQPISPANEGSLPPAANETTPPLVQPESAPPPAEELAPPPEEEAPLAPHSERGTDTQEMAPSTTEQPAPPESADPDSSAPAADVPAGDPMMP